jgi:1,4-dihydroxy-2-naphthoate octaprenyltransferase
MSEVMSRTAAKTLVLNPADNVGVALSTLDVGVMTPQGIKTLPVLLGERVSRRFTQGLMVSFYATVVALVIARALPWPALAALGAIPALVKVWKPFGQSRPEQPPRGFPVWPLWFAPIAFLHTRRAGALLILGLAVAAVFGIRA